jgi:dGTPase
MKRWEELLAPITFRDRTPKTDFDGRNPFESDYGRLISSSPIRRLQDKTQVFPLEQSDFIRTRLTHSLEVSYIASSIGTSVEKILIDKGELDKKYRGHLSSLLRVAGLVHDLGNPPFGHFGEKAIQAFFNDYFKTSQSLDLNDQEKKDFTCFDGNAQTFRILRKLHYFGDEFSYNLTFPSLASIIKYPSNSVEGNLGKQTEIRKKKFGYFISDEKEYQEINQKLLLNNNRHPIVYLLEAADDIAYCAADIEDGVKLGVIGYEEIHDIFSKNLSNNSDLIGKLEDAYSNIKANRGDKLSVVIQKFRTIAQAKMIGGVIKSFNDNYELIMEGKFQYELIEKSETNDIRQSFKKLQNIVFDNKKIMQAELAGWEAIYGLLGIFVPAILSTDDFKQNSKESRLYKNISSSFRYSYENYSNIFYENDKYNKIQLIVDFISGMTDSYAIALFQKLKGIKL